ncbi:glycosyltransferase family 4 protein [Mycolicibacterium sp. XJ652]
MPSVMASIAIAQSAAGMNVTVLGHPESDQRDRLIGSGVTYVDTRFTAWGRLPANIRLIRCQARRADLLHFHSSRAGLFRILFLLSKRSPVIEFSPHGWGWLAAPRFARRAYAMVERLLAVTTDRFHVLGTLELEEGHRRLGLPESRCTQIGNGVDTKQFAPTLDDTFSPRGGGVEILCVGRLCRQKGQDLLIRAASQLPDSPCSVTLTLIGSGRSEQELRRLASELNVEVDFLGNLTNLVDHYRRADIVVLPSRWEGVPLVALEAISCGCALLLTEPAADPQLREWAMTCEPSVEGIAAAIATLVNDVSARQRLRARAGQARTHIDEQVVLDAHVNLVRTLVAATS